MENPLGSESSLISLAALEEKLRPFVEEEGKRFALTGADPHDFYLLDGKLMITEGTIDLKDELIS